MSFDSPPRTACWQHHGLRSGFEVVYFSTGPGRVSIEGTTTGIQDGGPWVVRYTVELGALWNTRRARVTTRTALGVVDSLIESVHPGHWVIDGVDAADLEGCRDVDLESSALTNAFPGLQAIREHEKAIGDDAFGARVAMRRDLNQPSCEGSTRYP